jgi:broad specificity phosphatase PhoE
MSLRLLLIRHGQTAWNASGRFMGHHDIPLSELGLRQAAAVGRKLGPERPLVIYSSDLQRAYQTAQALLAAILASPQAAKTESEPGAPLFSPLHKQGGATEARLEGQAGDIHPGALEIITDPRLREMNFGEWAGKSYGELQAAEPEAMAAWEADLLHQAPPGGETLLEFAGRVQAVYAEIAQRHNEGTVMIVSHGGPLQLILAAVFGLPPERYWQFGVSNTGVCELNLYPAGAILNRLNDTSHLEGLA